jgi:alcohol dehydrogenase (cytochrome c)
VWRTFTIPAPGEPGSESWKDNHNAYRIGGASVWQTASYDPATNLLYYGTGDAFPTFDPEYRPGDNLYTASTIALDADTGKMVWYFQETPNEHWDFDTPSPKMLYEVNLNGEPRKVVANFSRNGFFYTLDRNSGQFLRADQYRRKSPGPKASIPRPASRPTTIRASTCSVTPASANGATSPGRKPARGTAARPRSFRRPSTPSA